jgi:hypothetical protein
VSSKRKVVSLSLGAAISLLTFGGRAADAKTEYSSCPSAAVCVRSSGVPGEYGAKFEWYETEGTNVWSSNGWTTPYWVGGQMRNRDWLSRYHFMYYVNQQGLTVNCKRLPYDSRAWVGFAAQSHRFSFYSVDTTTNASGHLNSCTGV